MTVEQKAKIISGTKRLLEHDGFSPSFVSEVVNRVADALAYEGSTGGQKQELELDSYPEISLDDLNSLDTPNLEL